MPWARFDDQFPINRKVNGLTDTEFRLHVEAVIWCARELTDGRVGRDELDLVSRIRSPKKHVAMLVIRKLWHLGDEECLSTSCPAHVDNRVDPTFDGWMIHDYFEFQFSKEQVLAEREGNAKRQKKWRDQQKQDRNGVTNGARNGVTNSAPSRPVPKGRGGVSVDEDLSLRNARTNNEDDLDSKIANLLREHASRGIDITPEWATKVRRQILDGRTVDNPLAYAAAAIRGAPGNYLPTSGRDPSSRSVAEAIAAARGDL
ncbi:MAG: hypothetical protein ACRDP6_14840 [Actinoallomurus sp.]